MKMHNRIGITPGLGNDYTASMRREVLKRISKRAEHLGRAVALCCYCVLIIGVIVTSCLGWLNANEQFGWAFGGLFLCGFIGFAAGFVYYTKTAWQDL